MNLRPAYLLLFFSIIINAQAPELTAEEIAMADKLDVDQKVLLMLRGASQAEFIGVEADEILGLPAIAMRMNHFDAPTVVKDLQTRLLFEGYVLFQSDQGDTSNDGLHEIRLLKTNDPLSPIRYMQTSAVEPALSNDAIFEKIEDWHGRYGLIIMGAGPKWIKAKVAIPLEDTVTFAKQLLEFCPKLKSFYGTEADITSMLKEMPNLELDWNTY
ncbi:DUF4253 domain-containing protein [uncultured Croceitalea sp.]|uniref:DUF4253 domain-containing protein n=1 Tax=uncultured Croceitalea sp. TaxID=1798908 RepID=UPI0033064B72